MAGQNNRLTWLWLLIGFVFTPFIGWQTVIPLAAWLAPVFLLRFSRLSHRARIALPAIFAAYLFGNIVAARGLPFSLIGLIGNLVFKSLAWTLAYGIDRALGSRLKGWARTLVFPLAFVSVDWGLSLLAVSSSGSPAYSQADFLALVQIISVTGMWALTFLIMWFASTANALWEVRFDWRAVWGQLAVFAGVFAAVLVFGIVRMATLAPAGQTVRVAAITPDNAVLQAQTGSIDWANFNRASDAQRAAVRPRLEATLSAMLDRSQAALKDGAQIVSWREEAAVILEEDEPAALGQAAALAKQYHAYLQISLGVVTHAAGMPFLRDQSILIGPGGATAWTYDKTHLVPFDEAFFTFHGPGLLPSVDSPYGRLSTAVCYDTYFPPLLREAGHNGADILFAPSNDVYPYRTSAAAMADFRAVEGGYSLVRATGSGLSLMADPEGRVLAVQDSTLSASGILLAGVPTRGVRTIYSQVGDVFATMCAAGFVLLIGVALFGRKEPAPETRLKPA